MVGPAAKREAVAHLRGVLEMSERRACSLVAGDRKMIRYRSRRYCGRSCVASVIELAFIACIGRCYLLKNKIENASKLLQTRPEQLGVGPRQNVHGLRAWKYRAPRSLRVKKPWSPFGR